MGIAKKTNKNVGHNPQPVRLGPELHAEVDDLRAKEKERSFSSMLRILIREGIKARTQPQSVDNS